MHKNKSKMARLVEEPDITVAGLSIWVSNREFPDSDDYWDGNWLNIRAQVKAPGAVVNVDGPWVRNVEIAGFAKGLATLYSDQHGSAELDCIELMLNVKVVCGSSGQIDVIVEATPDQLTQAHRFHFEIDQSYLPAILAGCQRVLERFPIKGNTAPIE